MRSLTPLPALAFTLAFMSCRSAPLAGDAPTAWEAESPVRPLPAPPLGIAADLKRAKVQVTPEKVRLGRWLFFDGRLSRDGTVSCASCHRPENAFSEPTPHSTGVGGKQGTRKAPPIVNAAVAIFDHYFWDGRAGSLAEQAKGPIENPLEMASTRDDVVRTLSGIAGYRKAFREAYGDERVDIDRVADAIAAYEITRLSGGSAYDRFQAGDESALSEKAKRGMEVFFGRGRCSACHLGPNFTDARFHNIGIGFARPPEGRSALDGFADVGRYAVTRQEADIGAFKTPALRDVSKHAPYMHDGSEPTLERAVLRYVQFEETPYLDAAMKEMHLMPCDVAPLVEFMRALDGTGYEDAAPRALPQ
jgi:cytochrome c peroxidase